ncbi:MAG TPA: sigma-70 family RNA polymerase sigma factor [Candidatus Sulfotelmatobacter sp.]|nr:sigma-70 family RNA polymerase sigma factor [Candidatus Sulfotelmatobacter sp.]
MSTDVKPKFEDHTSPYGGYSPRHVFATTQWSVVLTAGRAEFQQAQDALETLCRTYWYPLYAYVRRRGFSPADAEDLTQEFFAWLLDRKWLGKADPQRGRFRSFLLTSISNFLANEWDKARTQKRGGGKIISLERDEAENRYNWQPLSYSIPESSFTPEQSFEWRWALTLLDQVMGRLTAEFEHEKKKELFEALKPCLLGDSSALPYATLATSLGMSEGSIKVTVHRLRQRYRQLLREEIATTVAVPEEVEEELRYLFSVLTRR